MDFEELEKRINENTIKLDKLTNEIEANFKRINTNTEKIHHNTGALDILKGFKAVSITIFVMWLVTFITLLFFVFN